MKKPTAAGHFGRWTVESDGTITGSYTTGGKNRKLVRIYPDRLSEADILLSFHADRMPPEEWSNFMPAWFLACRLAGITRTEIQTDFE